MVMCSKCHKRMAVIFVTKLENGKKVSDGVCLKCAKEMGLPVDKMIGDTLSQFGMSAEDMEAMEDNLADMAGELPSDFDDNEDGGAPAIDMPKLFGDGGLFGQAPKGESEGAMSDKSDAKDGADKGKGKQMPKKKKFLTTYCRNLTNAAREGKIDRIVGREKELARMMQILCRRQKNNPCLIGEPGVGKTAIAEGLAQRIAKGEVPFKLRDKEVFLLDS